MLLASVMRAPDGRFGAGGDPLSGPSRPDGPATAEDFVHALECLVRARGNDPNPRQVEEVLDGVLQAGLLPALPADQLASVLKNLAVICAVLPRRFVEALAAAARLRMAELDVRGLSNVSWALMRLAPAAGGADARAAWGLCDRWLEEYQRASAARLADVAARRAPAPTGQQLANLLLLPAAARRPPPRAWLDAHEGALAVAERRLCGLAVAQMFTCFVRLQVRPSARLLELLLRHLREDLELYDHDELTQVAAGAAALPGGALALPSTLLADATERAAMLKASGRADPADSAVLRSAMDVLARAAAAAAAPAGTEAVTPTTTAA